MKEIISWIIVIVLGGSYFFFLIESWIYENRIRRKENNISNQ